MNAEVNQQLEELLQDFIDHKLDRETAIERFKELLQKYQAYRDLKNTATKDHIVSHYQQLLEKIENLAILKKELKTNRLDNERLRLSFGL
ncbi:MAG: hypothetical protein AAGF77_05885 [Bacteroidota bacterium]